MHHGDHGRLSLEVHIVRILRVIHHPGVVAAIRWHVHGHALLLPSHVRKSAVVPVSATPLAPEVAHAHAVIALVAAARLSLLRGS